MFAIKQKNHVCILTSFRIYDNKENRLPLPKLFHPAFYCAICIFFYSLFLHIYKYLP